MTSVTQISVPGSQLPPMPVLFQGGGPVDGKGKGKKGGKKKPKKSPKKKPAKPK